MPSVLRMCTSQAKTYLQLCIICVHYMLQVKTDSQFPLSPKPNSSIIKARTQRKLRINLSSKILMAT